MIDAHCHVTYIENIDREIAEWKDKGMKAVVTSALGIKEAEKSLELRNEYSDFVFLCFGLHPGDIGKFTSKQTEEYVEFIGQNRKNIVAIGEVGLDYNWVTDKTKQEKSKEIFLQMIELANALNLPLVIHTRNGRDGSAVADALAMLKENNAKQVMMHCFSGNESELRTALSLGYFISYATNICWTKKHTYLAAKTPLEQMLMETDSPWLDPDSSFGERKLENRPWKINKSAEVIEKIKGIPKEEILKITADNARKFFSIQMS